MPGDIVASYHGGFDRPAGLPCPFRSRERRGHSDELSKEFRLKSPDFIYKSSKIV
jgi:hypothetical protein